MGLYFTGLLLMLLSFWYSKIIIQKALFILDDNKKALLLTLFQTENKYKGLLVIAGLGIYFLAIQFTTISYQLLIGMLFVFFISIVIYNYKTKVVKLKENDFPAEYIKQFNIAAFVQIAGILFLLITSLFIF
jgi:hypothetical protein